MVPLIGTCLVQKVNFTTSQLFKNSIVKLCEIAHSLSWIVCGVLDLGFCIYMTDHHSRARVSDQQPLSHHTDVKMTLDWWQVWVLGWWKAPRSQLGVWCWNLPLPSLHLSHDMGLYPQPPVHARRLFLAVLVVMIVMAEANQRLFSRQCFMFMDWNLVLYKKKKESPGCWFIFEKCEK